MPISARRWGAFVFAALVSFPAASADTSLGTNTYTPEPGVICDSYACANGTEGLSPALTTQYVGAAAGENIADLVKDPDTSAGGFTFEDGRYCDTTLRLCFVDRYFTDGGFRGKVDLAHTLALFAAPKLKAEVEAAALDQAVSDPNAAIWSVYTSDTDATLTHGVPETDDADFVAICDLASNRVAWQLPIAPEGYGADSEATALVFATPFDTGRTYALTPVLNQQYGTHVPEAQVEATGPVLEWISRGDVLSLVVAGQRIDYPLTGSFKPARAFITACRKD